MFEPTVQQDGFRHWVVTGEGSAELTAVAGSGKTTTVVWATQFMEGEVALLAYNKKIADELNARIRPEDARRVTAGTFHSFGLRALKANGLAKIVDAKKVMSLTRNDPISLQPFVRKAVSLAKQHMLTPADEGWGEMIEHYALHELLMGNGPMLADGVFRAQQVLAESNADTTRVDFDDMIYLAALNGLVAKRYQWVLIDEAQDTNPARRAFAERLLAPGGRLVAVGDPHQAIYGFTGADANALDLIRERFNSTRLPLTVSFRCPKAVVRLAQQFVSHIESAPNADEGSVEQMDFEALLRAPAEAFPREAAMICRLTKPLVQFAYHLIGRGIPCHVEGRDIGTSLTTLIQKVQKRYGRPAAYVPEFMGALQDYEEFRTTQLLAQEKDAEAERLGDQCEVLRVIAGSMPRPEQDRPALVSELAAAIARLFEDTTEGEGPRSFTLSTVHKAKGREWDRVYLLGRNKYMPSRWAKQRWELEQEVNLMYVAVTRAKKELVEVVLP